MRISINGLESIRRAVDKFGNLKIKCYLLASRLCEVGEPIIRETHGNHASISVEPLASDNGYCIRADGEDILFIEFGTGDHAGDMSSQYDEVPTYVRPGAWSESHAQMYSRYGFWVFAGKIYHYTDPHPAFYYAYKAMVDALPKIAQEVFDS